MKTLVKLFVPLALVATLFSACGGGDEVKCDPACATGKICLKTGDTNKGTCETKAKDDGTCDSGNPTDSKDATPVKYCKM